MSDNSRIMSQKIASTRSGAAVLPPRRDARRARPPAAFLIFDFRFRIEILARSVARPSAEHALPHHMCCFLALRRN